MRLRRVNTKGARSGGEHREIVMGRGRKIRWTLGLLRPYRTRIIFMAFAVVASTASALAPPYLAGRAIDSGIEAGNISALDVTVALFVVAIVVNAVTSWLQTWLVGWVGIRVLQDLREPAATRHQHAMLIGHQARGVVREVVLQPRVLVEVGHHRIRIGPLFDVQDDAQSARLV